MTRVTIGDQQREMIREKLTIERDRTPLRMHKNLVVRVLTDHPEDLPQVAPTWEGTAAELIAALKRDSRQWIVGGELSE